MARIPPSIREMLLDGKRALASSQCSVIQAQASAPRSRLVRARRITYGAFWDRTWSVRVRSNVRAKSSGSSKSASR